MISIDKIRYKGGVCKLPWGYLVVKGKDSNVFLSGQTTNDIEPLKDQEGQLNCLSNIQGKIESFFFLIKDSDQFLLFMPEEFLGQTKSRLEKYIIMEEVEIKNGTQDFYLSVGQEESLSFSLNIRGEKFYICKDSNADTDWECFESYFWFLGVPFYSKEILYKTMLTDTPLVFLATSFDKGCFLGQEIISKIHNNRGATYFPMLFRYTGDLEIKEGENFVVENNKGGEVKKVFYFQGQTYFYATLYRDFRVHNREQNLKFADKKLQATSKHFSEIDSSIGAKATELYDLAHRYFINGEEDKAKQIFEEVIEIDPLYSDAYESLGVIYGRHQNFDKAIELMKKLAELDPSSVMAHTNLSLYYMKIGEIEKAEEEKSKATMKSFSKFGEEAASKKKLEEEKKKKEEELIRRESMFKQVLEIDKDDTLALYGLGEICFERGKFKESVDLFKRVLKNDEKYSVAYLALGRSYLKNNQKNLAKEIFEKGIRIAASKGDMMPANQMQSLLSSI